MVIAGVVWREVLRRKDIYVLFILLAALLVALLALNVFGLSGAVGYLKEIGLLLAWLFSWILAVVVSVRQLPQEEARGTILTLLAKPVTRGSLIVGKWLGAWSVVAAATLAFYLLLVGVVAGRGGSFGLAVLGQGFLLHLGLLAVLAAMGIMFSTRLNGDAAASLTFVLSLAAYLILPRVPDLIKQETGLRQTGLLILHYALPHLELFDLRRRLVYGYEPVASGVWLPVVLYGAVLTALLLLLAWLAYRRKRIGRSALA
jgi:ABC-type transport system involved in multi-copper enzyme maturation permease subunit